MPFVPNQFLSHMKGRGGPSKSSRFQTIIPLPQILGKNVNYSNFSAVAEFITDPQGAITSKVFGDYSVDKVSLNPNERKYSRPEISRFLSLQCETTNFPSKTLQVNAAKTYGPVFQIPTAVQYGNFTMTFLCTNDFYEKKLFERWIEEIMPPSSNNFKYPKGDSPTNSYYSEISVFQYDDFVKQVYGIKLKDAFPTSINDLTLNWGDDGFHRLTVNFAYQKYTSIYEGKYDPEAIVAAAIGGFSGFIPDMNNILQF